MGCSNLKLSGLVIALAACLGVGAGAPRLGAQVPARLGGTLLNRTTLVPIDGARMSVLGTNLVTSTDSAGFFEFRAVPAGVRVLQARAIGYALGSWVVQLSEGQYFQQPLELEPRAAEMEPITVTGRMEDLWRSEAGFETRRARGLGFFLTREDIQRRNAPNLAELLRAVPGVSILCRGSLGCEVTIGRNIGRRCSPEYYLDGFPATFATGPSFPVQQLRGIEIYRDASEIPVELHRTGQRCGVIAIWTVDPGTRLERY